jgi:hypothetical protein
MAQPPSLLSGPDQAGDRVGRLPDLRLGDVAALGRGLGPDTDSRRVLPAQQDGDSPLTYCAIFPSLSTMTTVRWA